MTPRRRKARAALLTLAGMGWVAGGLVYLNWAAVERYADWSRRLALHRDGGDAVCRDFAAGRFRAGSRVDDLIAAHPPAHVARAGRYTVVQYKPTYRQGTTPGGAVVVAKDGRLASASVGGIGWSKVEVFDHMSRPDDFELIHSLRVLSAAQAPARRDALMAAAGPAAALSYQAGTGTRIWLEP